jgi:hypothetical protein
MPPRKKKRKAKTPKSTQRQSQRQSVVVNIGSTSKSKPRKSSGRGGLPPPSHMHNLAPTFVTAPQVDYTPLLAMMQHHARPIVAQAPMPVQNPTTPLSSVSTQTNIDARSPQQLAGEAALRRAGKTAGNFQTPASEARMRPEPEPIGAPQPRPKPSGFPTLNNPISEPVLGDVRRSFVQAAAYTGQQRQARQSGLTSQKSGLEQAQEAISMIIKANPPPGSVSSVATSAPTKLSSSAVSGQVLPEQDLGGFLSPFGTVPPEAKKPKSKGRPAGAKNKPKDTSQTTIPFRRQGL